MGVFVVVGIFLEWLSFLTGPKASVRGLFRYLEWSGTSEAVFALESLSAESNVSHQVVAAVDINTTANDVYRHNFPRTALLNRTIEVCVCALRCAALEG